MIRHLLLALALVSGASSAAQAQNARVISGGCGSPPASLPANDASALFMDSVGRLCVSGGAAETKAGSGGVAGFSRIQSSAATTNLTQAKAGAGRVYKIVACNTTTTATRIKLYNALAASVTVGTTPPLFTRPIPAAPAAGGLACTSYDMADIGWSFSTGISYALTAGAADSDTTAVAAGAITDLSVEYQ